MVTKKVRIRFTSLFIVFVLSLFLSTKNVVALGETGTFTELQTLINDFTGETLVLQKDYKNSGSENQITISKDVVLDLNGHIINADFKSNVFYVSGGHSLTIEDSDKTAVHKFDVDEWSLATLNEESGTLVINGGCIMGGNYIPRNSVGAAVHLNNGTLILNSGNIIGNKISGKYQFGAGIGAENNSTVIINGGMVSYNSAAWECYGGGIYLNNSDLTINGGAVSHNYGIYGGGINVNDGSSLIANGGTISNNKAGHNGGGIASMVSDAKVSQGVVSKVTINDGIIENNTVVTPWIGVGGGIATNKGSDLTINGGIIRRNNATRGGGVGAWTGGNIKILGGVISENIATEDTTPTDGSVGNYGAGVFFNTYFINGYGSVDAELTVGGNTIITGNINAVSNKEDNLYLANGQKINIGTDANAPSDKMNVNINMETYGDFTINGGQSDAKYFSVDNSDYYVKYESGTLKAIKDIVAPTGKITLKEDIFLSFIKDITFGLFYKENFNVLIEGYDDNGIKLIEYYVSQTEKTLDEVKGITEWETYSELNIDSEDKYIIYAKITDNAGNVTYLSSNGFVLDTTAPVINGISYGNGFYYTTQKFTVDDSYIDKVLINGVETTDYILPGNVDETYEIDAFDKAGNPTYLSIRMMPIDTIDVLIDEYTVENVTIDNKEDIEYIKDKAAGIDITNATDDEKAELQEIINRCNLLLSAIEEKNAPEIPNVPNTGSFIAEHATAIAGLAIGFPVFAVLLYIVKRSAKR